MHAKREGFENVRQMIRKAAGGDGFSMSHLGMVLTGAKKSGDQDTVSFAIYEMSRSFSPERQRQMVDSIRPRWGSDQQAARDLRGQKERKARENGGFRRRRVSGREELGRMEAEREKKNSLARASSLAKELDAGFAQGSGYFPACVPQIEKLLRGETLVESAKGAIEEARRAQQKPVQEKPREKSREEALGIVFKALDYDTHNISAEETAKGISISGPHSGRYGFCLSQIVANKLRDYYGGQSKPVPEDVPLGKGSGYFETLIWSMDGMALSIKREHRHDAGTFKLFISGADGAMAKVCRNFGVIVKKEAPEEEEPAEREPVIRSMRDVFRRAREPRPSIGQGLIEKITKGPLSGLHSQVGDFGFDDEPEQREEAPVRSSVPSEIAIDAVKYFVDALDMLEKDSQSFNMRVYAAHKNGRMLVELRNVGGMSEDVQDIIRSHLMPVFGERSAAEMNANGVKLTQMMNVRWQAGGAGMAAGTMRQAHYITTKTELGSLTNRTVRLVISGISEKDFGEFVDSMREMGMWDKGTEKLVEENRNFLAHARDSYRVDTYKDKLRPYEEF